MNSDYDLIVIGGGSGGIATARRAAAHSARTVLIEDGPIGGTCVNVGCVPKKVMWNAAWIAHTLRHAPAYGFDLQTHKFRWSVIKEARDAYLARLRDIYDRNLDLSEVERIDGRARFLDADTVTVDGRALRAPHILIATGSTPVVPEIPGARLGITSDGFFELPEQPRCVAVIGGGYIAVEFAGLLNTLGSDVTQVLRGESFLKNFDATLRETLMEEMQRAGVSIVTGARLDAIEGEAGNITLRCHGRTMTGFDCLIWATGRRANTGDLSLAAAGVATDAQGDIRVDPFQATSRKGVYALGDVTGQLALTPVAIAAGRALADRLFGGKTDARLDYENIPTVVFGHPPIGTVGLSEDAARELYGQGAIKVYQSRFINMLYAVDDEKPPTVVRLITAGDQEKVVGCHIIGDFADEIIQGFAVALKMGAHKKDFDNTLAIHPTAAEELVTLK